MDESQIDKLGNKMRDVYADVANEAPVPAAPAPKHPSRRLRKSQRFAGASGRISASTPGSAATSLVRQHPRTSLMVAMGVGFLLARR
jgi:ElaB/YqjD/DUF883 family membrane-anchored ribosome-binding protein